ncbi:MAG: hypothetical protein QXN05_02380 [Acidilobaceae archaeon]
MSVSIPLYPETLFGYYLQLTALALGGWKGPVTGQIKVSSENYVNLVNTAINNIIQIRLGKQVSPNEVCNYLKGPRVYRSDSGFLKKADLPIPARIEPDKYWCVATMNYVNKVIEKQGPLDKTSYSLQPLRLLRATIYGTTRGVKRKEVEDLVKNTTIDSLGLGLIGGLASYIGSFKLKSKHNKRGEVYEYFLIPDGSSESLEYISEVLEAFHGTILGSDSLVDKIKKLAIIETKMNEKTHNKQETCKRKKEEEEEVTRTKGLSLDLATHFSTLVQALETVNMNVMLRGAIDKMMFERFLLVRNVAGGNRPQIMWISPLAVSQIVTEVKAKNAEEVLINLYKLAQKLASLHVTSNISEKSDKKKNKALDPASKCVNNIILYLWSGQLDFLAECSRELAVLFDETLENKNMKDLEYDVYRLLSNITRLTKLR